MTHTQHIFKTDIAIRLAGSGLCAIAYAAFQRVFALDPAPPPAPPGLLALALAMTGFLATSFGIGLVLLGHRVLDQIEVSGRWQRAPAPRMRGARSQMARAAVDHAPDRGHHAPPTEDIPPGCAVATPVPPSLATRAPASGRSFVRQS